MAAAGKKRSLWNFADRFEGDKVVWIIVLMLILLSIVCIFSSTSQLLKDGQTRLDIVRNQLLIVVVGLCFIVLCYNIKDIKVFRFLSKLGFPLSLLLLGILDLHLDFGVVRAVEINKAWRIIQIPGLQIHVFEVVKVAMVMYLSWAIDAFNKKELKGPVKPVWQKILYIYAPALLTIVMVLPGSNSSALFIGGIMFITILLGGGSAKDLCIFGASCLLLLGLSYGVFKVSNGKMMQRIGTGINRIFEHTDNEAIFLDPNSTTEQRRKAIDAIRQPYSARIAVKEGGLFGKGPGQSTQRYKVPDYSEDYMYSFIIEEYGLVGGIIVLCLYVSLLARASIIVRNCGKDTYAKLVVAGLSILITGQAFLHMFVNAEIGPMTGQTLPLISHGNSAFICFSIAFGVILSFSRIASRRIEKEAEDAAPLVDLKEVPADGSARSEDPLYDGINDLYDIENTSDYGI